MSERENPASVSELLQAVAWDYDPEDDFISPLTPTDRYFRDFPWEPEEGLEGGGAAEEAKG